MPTIIVSGCVILQNGKLLAIKKKDRDFYELPGGRMKPKENAEENALRKTTIQTGVLPDIIQQFDILEFQKDQNNIEINIFECSLNPKHQFKPGENVEEVKWLEIKKLDQEKIGEDIKTLKDELL